MDKGQCIIVAAPRQSLTASLRLTDRSLGRWSCLGIPIKMQGPILSNFPETRQVQCRQKVAFWKSTSCNCNSTLLLSLLVISQQGVLNEIITIIIIFFIIYCMGRVPLLLHHHHHHHHHPSVHVLPSLFPWLNLLMEEIHSYPIHSRISLKIYA